MKKQLQQVMDNNPGKYADSLYDMMLHEVSLGQKLRYKLNLQGI